MTDDKKHIGATTKVDFPEVNLFKVPVRVDTGARLSSIWGTAVERDGKLHVHFFGKDNPLFTGETFTFDEYEQIVVASSMGHLQKRYQVKLLVKIRGKKVRASFTLANRSTQVYPVLVGRNVLRGKFVVDVTKGQSLFDKEKLSFHERQSKIAEIEEDV